MSKVAKGIKKTFKKAVKFVKRYGPQVLAAGAIVLTAGAALAPAGSALAGASLSGVAGSITSSMGLSGTLGSVVSGALSQASAGAALGGVISEVSGGSFKDGAKMGAAAGAITGGLGGLGPAAPAPTGPTGNLVQQAAQNPIASHINPQPLADLGVQVSNSGGLMSGLNTAASGVGNFVSNNQQLVGGLLQGVGAGQTAQAQIDAQNDLYRRRQQNYNVDIGSGYRGLSAPQNQYAAARPAMPDFEFQFDMNQGRMVRVPV